MTLKFQNIISFYVPSIIMIILMVASTCFTSHSYIDIWILPKWIIFAYGTCAMLILSSIIRIAKSKDFIISNLNHNLIFCSGLLILIYLYFCSQSQKDIIVFFILYSFCILCISLNKHIPILSIYSLSLIICGIISSIFAIIQIKENEEITGCYDNVVGFTLTIALASLSLIHLLISEYDNKSVLSIFLKVLLIFFIILLFISKSRVALLSLCAGSIILINKKKKIIISCAILVIVSISVFNLQKKESTYGRWFILNTTLSLLDSPAKIAFGYGEDGFKQNYMIRQSQKLISESNETKQRASNIIHPLNEFLLLTIKYGMIAIIILALTLLFFFKNKHYNFYSKALVLTIVIFSLFSYPFKYPISYVTIAMAVASCDKSKWRIFQTKKDSLYIFRRLNTYGVSLITLSLSFILLHITLELDTNMKKWKSAYENSILGNQELALRIYKETSYNNQSSGFIFNYASYLYNMGKYTEAEKLIQTSTLKDYETAVLSGKIKKAVGSDSLAIEQFKLAHDMCPNRFIPLFEIYKIYRGNNKPMQERYATLILSKSIKIPSNQIDEILNTIRNDQINNPDK